LDILHGLVQKTCPYQDINMPFINHFLNADISFKPGVKEVCANAIDQAVLDAIRKNKELPDDMPDLEFDLANPLIDESEMEMMHLVFRRNILPPLDSPKAFSKACRRIQF